MFGRRLAVYVGPMFSGKTEAAQAEIRKALVAKRSVVFFRPARANRGDEHAVVSHAQNTVPDLQPVMIGEGEEGVLYERGKSADVIIVDEGQFLRPAAAEPILRLFLEGHVVVYCALDADYRGEPFETSIAVMGIPEAEIHRLTAVCVSCRNARATRTQKLVDGKPVPLDRDSPRLETGGSEKYRAVCLECFLFADGSTR